MCLYCKGDDADPSTRLCESCTGRFTEGEQEPSSTPLPESVAHAMHEMAVPADDYTVSFDVTLADRLLIKSIVSRFIKHMKGIGARPDRMGLTMDITATHANGNPLRLAALLSADDFNLLHDVFGIQKHLDRTTGKLGNCFRPRFSASKSARGWTEIPAGLEREV